MLAVLVGAGVQATLVVFLLLACMAAKNYHYFELEHSSMVGWSRWLLILTSVVGGYAAARTYKMWNGQNWLVLALVTSATLPLTLTVSLSIENSMKLL